MYWKSDMRSVLMTDDSIEANAIEIDHNAMLASDPAENSAFLKVFGRFKRSSLDAPGGATQLSQLAPKTVHRRKKSHHALARLNSKLASQMQAQLTETAQSNGMPKLKLDKSRSAKTEDLAASQVALKISSPATLDALHMTDSHTHLLPRKLRTEFAIRHGKKVLSRSKLPGVQDDISRKAVKSSKKSGVSHADITAAGKADDSLLASIPTNMNAAELVQRAAMKQMKLLHVAAPPAAKKRPAQVVNSPLQQFQPYTYPQPQALYPAGPYPAQPAAAYQAQPAAAYPPAAVYPPQQPAANYVATAYAAPPVQQALYHPIQQSPTYYARTGPGFYAAPAAYPYNPQQQV